MIQITYESGKEEVKFSGDYLPHSPKKFVILDACTAIPAIVSRKRRNVDVMVGYCEKRNRRGVLTYAGRKSASIMYRRCIEVVNAIEDGRFKKVGYHFGVTGDVANELEILDRQLIGGNSESWLDESNGHVTRICLPSNELRKKYSHLSMKMPEIRDFSIAIAALILNCSFASEDYRSFNESNRSMSGHALKALNEAFREKWGIMSEFEKHDAESLLMRLASKA